MPIRRVRDARQNLERSRQVDLVDALEAVITSGVNPVGLISFLVQVGQQDLLARADPPGDCLADLPGSDDNNDFTDDDLLCLLGVYVWSWCGQVRTRTLRASRARVGQATGTGLITRAPASWKAYHFQFLYDRPGS